MINKPKTGYFTVEKCANMMKKSARRLQQMFDEAILRETDAEGHALRYQYNTSDNKPAYYYCYLYISQTYQAHLETQLRQGSKTMSGKKEEHLAIRTKREEVKYLKEIGELLNYADVMKLFTLIVATYRDNRRGTAARLATPISEEVVHRLKALINATLGQSSLDKKQAAELHRLFESEINESRLREKLVELLKEHINAENNTHLNELADDKFIRGAFPQPLAPGTGDPANSETAGQDERGRIRRKKSPAAERSRRKRPRKI